MNLHVCAIGIKERVSWVVYLGWLRVAYQGQADEISIGNKGEDVANNFHREVQQRKLSTHLHPSVRGKWEVVDGVETRR